MKKRQATLTRHTNETKITATLNLDGTGKNSINTGLGFLNHLLELFTVHGHFDLQLEAQGDLHVDDHHTVEDIGIVLGQLVNQSLQNKKGIHRYGFFILPMDEVLTTTAIDLSGRYSFVFDATLQSPQVGQLSTELVYDFWDSFAQNARLNLIIKSEFGRNTHHQIEGIFKATARALKKAILLDPTNLDKIPSTKGSL